MNFVRRSLLSRPSSRLALSFRRQPPSLTHHHPRIITHKPNLSFASSSFSTLNSSSSSPPLKVSFIGSGNWGTAAASIAAQNVLRHDDFDDHLRMYVHEESVPGPDEGTFTSINPIYKHVCIGSHPFFIYI